MVPFLVNTRRLCRMGFEPRTKSWMEAVNQFVKRMKEATEEAKSALQKAKDHVLQLEKSSSTGNSTWR